ncbi:hypothetical protein ASD64_10595 [Mesorhizobium sp. Root157]|uniref:STAS/SEC14 domain-containing protein n=1 Tax=Mesorhizobium sp. Root157 TaxID=1736477 RepID=UPI0006F9295E|nr:STAS/SEC14 domain-containing protein [Mesorhizobium sp. Root157]KQZ81426.1 hypothetical protein ASD64_10595 [Mesorhizobium sp. Root157]
MSFLESVPAIRRIETTRSDLLAVDIVGMLTPADAENLFGLLEAAYALHPRIDVFVRLADYEGVEWTHIASETVEKGKAEATEHVGRCASVGEPNWIADVQGLFTPSLPVELKHFAAADEAAAWKWLGAQPLA